MYDLDDRDREVLAAMAEAGGDLPADMWLTDDDLIGLNGLIWYCASRECWSLRPAGWTAAGYEPPGHS